MDKIIIPPKITRGTFGKMNRNSVERVKKIVELWINISSQSAKLTISKYTVQVYIEGNFKNINDLKDQLPESTIEKYRYNAITDGTPMELLVIS